jgi:hypothetical protein
MGLDKVWDYANFKNIFIVGIVVSVISLLAISGQFAVTGSTFSYISLAIAGGCLVFFFVMAKRADDIMYRDSVMGEVMSGVAVNAMHDGQPRVEMFENDMIIWQWESEPQIVHAAQIIEAANPKMTSHDMSEMELARMTRDYESIKNTPGVDIIAVEARKKIASPEWLRALERKRDNWKLDADMGGRYTQLEKAEATTSTIRRMKESMEYAYDSRFFLMVATDAPTIEEVKQQLKPKVNAIADRMRDQLKLDPIILKGAMLKEGTRFFRVYTALGPPRNKPSRLLTIRTLSLDLGFHTPFATPRLPPLSKLIKGIYIGHVITDNRPVHWDPTDPEMPNFHALILGLSGSGKTTAGRTFLYRALEIGIPYWALDPAGDYVELTKRLGGAVIDFESETINPFVLYGQNPVNVAKNVTDMVTLVSGLRGAERQFFQETILQEYAAAGVDVSDNKTWTDEASNRVNFTGIYEKLKAKLGSLSATEEFLARGVVHKIQDLSIGQFALREQSLNLDELFRNKKPVCFYLREALGEGLRKTIAWTILTQLRAMAFTRYKISEELRLFCLVDEAHHFTQAAVHPDLPGGRLDTPITDFIREMRKKGVAIWLLSQSPADFLSPGERMSPIFLNVATTIMLGKADVDYMEFVKRYMKLSEEDTYGPNGLYWMTRHGQGILKKGNDPRSIPIQIDAEEITKTADALEAAVEE